MEVVRSAPGPCSLSPDPCCPIPDCDLNGLNGMLLTMARRGIRIIFLAVTACLLTHGLSAAAIVDGSSVRVTDVTPVQFAVVWTTSEPATCWLNVFDDAEGTVPSFQAMLISESAQHSPAEDLGVMKVRVVGLKPDTRYFFQIKSTSKNDKTVNLYPSQPPFLEVTTEKINLETNILVQNDVLAQEVTASGGKSTDGMLIIASVEGASHPITGWVGDGVPGQRALIDTNNFYDVNTHEGLELPEKPEPGSEVIINLMLVTGTTGLVETQGVIPSETGGIQSMQVVMTLPDSGSGSGSAESSGGSGGGGGGCFIATALDDF